jgi:hypothetical protein
MKLINKLQLNRFILNDELVKVYDWQDNENVFKPFKIAKDCIGYSTVPEIGSYDDLALFESVLEKSGLREDICNSFLLLLMTHKALDLDANIFDDINSLEDIIVITCDLVISGLCGKGEGLIFWLINLLTEDNYLALHYFEQLKKSIDGDNNSRSWFINRVIFYWMQYFDTIVKDFSIRDLGFVFDYIASSENPEFLAFYGKLKFTIGYPEDEYDAISEVINSALNGSHYAWEILKEWNNEFPELREKFLEIFLQKGSSMTSYSVNT